ncbi:MAG: GMC family oxidoreductase, partial [Leptospiraceae bacterium]|nr:GMC family oxidoreductase [Leptospiraceae bacterium]
YSEKVACGPIQNTVRKFFRTSVMNFLKKQKFTIILNKKVMGFLIKESGEIYGVETDTGNILADYVIVSAGVIGSCSLFMNEKNKKPNSNFSRLFIGENIQDHTNLRVNVISNKPIDSLNEVYDSQFKKLKLGIKHFLGIPTVMRGTGATSAAYLDLDKDGSIDTRIQILQFSETGRHASKGSLFSTSEPSFSISINAIHPESKGKLLFEKGKLEIDPKFLSSPKDIEILKSALRYCIELLKENPLNQHVLKIEDEELIESNPEKYIKDMMYSGHHLIGGLQDAIDSNFEVKGFKNLFVCDASIFDQYIASNIHSSVVLLSDLFGKKFIINQLKT